MKRTLFDRSLLGKMSWLLVNIAIVTFSVFSSQTSETSPASTPIDSNELLEKVADTYRNLRRYQFDFTLLTEIRSAAGRKSVETHIDLTIIRPDKLRILISGGLGDPPITLEEM